jgi:hypothetical protein
LVWGAVAEAVMQLLDEERQSTDALIWRFAAKRQCPPFAEAFGGQRFFKIRGERK